MFLFLKGKRNISIYNYIFTSLYHLFQSPEDKGEANIVTSNWLKDKNKTKQQRS